jgi:hypothetical protein
LPLRDQNAIAVPPTHFHFRIKLDASIPLPG